jgi:hypothetical protein
MAEKKTERRKTHPPTAKGAAGKKCSVEGCKRAYQAKGYCFFHYDKWKKGDLAKARHKVKPPQKAAAGAPAAAPAPPAAPAAPTSV